MKIMIYTTKGGAFDKNKPVVGAVYDEERKHWFIELDTIEELMTLCMVTGTNLVIGNHYPYDDDIEDDDDNPFIEIYNDYRE